MGVILKGILGGFSGKVGTVIGSNWRGKDVMRSLPKRSKKLPTENQMKQRLKFGLVTHFLGPLGEVIGLYFGQPHEYKSRMNLAVSYHIKQAIIGTYPEYELDFTKVVLTKGDLPGVVNGEVIALVGGEITYTWDDNTGGTAEATDKLIIVVYEKTNGFYFVDVDAADRSVGTVTIDLPAYLTGLTVESWLSFVTVDLKKASNSLFMGGVVVL